MLYSEVYSVEQLLEKRNLQYLEQLDLREERVKRLISAPDISKDIHLSLNSFNFKRRSTHIARKLSKCDIVSS